MYVSPITSPVITDAEADELQAKRVSFGYQPRDYEAQPPGTVQFCAPFPRELYIPRSEWRDRIEEQDKTETSLYHIRKRAGIKTRSQGQTNYCWAHGTVNALRVIRAMNGLPYKDFNPTAVACQIKGFRNVGGNTFDAIPFIAKNGVPTTEHWKLNEINRSRLTPEVKAEALENRLEEWWELPSNDFDAMASCLLRPMPVVNGLMWWMHMILGLRLRAGAGRDEFLVEHENSHVNGRTSDDGLVTLSEKKSTAFDQAAPRVIMAT